MFIKAVKIKSEKWELVELYVANVLYKNQNQRYVMDGITNPRGVEAAHSSAPRLTGRHTAHQCSPLMTYVLHPEHIQTTE